MTEFEVESMSEGSEPEDDSDLEVNLMYFDKIYGNLKCRILWPCVDIAYLHHFQLQEAFARGDLKPGLNIEVGNGPRKAVNNIVSCNSISSSV